MQKMNESIIDLTELKGSFGTGGETENDSLLLGKIKKKKSSFFDIFNSDEKEDEIQNIVEIVNAPIPVPVEEIVEPAPIQEVEEIPFLDVIVVPEPIQEEAQKQKTSSFNLELKIKEAKERLNFRKKKKSEIQQIVVEKEQEIRQDYLQVNNKELPENINLPEIVEELVEAIEDIENIDEINLNDFDIKAIPNKTDKTGYSKTLVTIKKSSFPREMGKLATLIKKNSNNVVIHRVMDMRTIGNTNKTQLRGSELKLTSTSINFKPKSSLLKVNKGTRFIISIPEDYQSTKNLIVYIQESRSKFITLIKGNKFENEDKYFEYLSEIVSKYYQYGFEVTKRDLLHQGVKNPLLAVIKNVLATNEFKAKPKTDEETGKVSSILIISKKEKNQWMGVAVRDAQVAGTYTVQCISKLDDSWRFGVVSKTEAPITISDLTGEKFITILNTLYNQNWNHLGENEDTDAATFMLINKLTYKNLREVFIKIDEIKEENPEVGIIIKETLSQIDTAKSIPGSYAAEGIIGKTDFIDYYILTYLAVPVAGGDKRNTRDYITTKEYKEKYDVKTNKSIEERSIIIKTEDSDRNYNSRPYMFQLEYSINGKTSSYIAKDFNTILEDTKIFTKKPILK